MIYSRHYYFFVQTFCQTVCVFC